MAEPESGDSGLLGSARRVGSSLLGLVQNRVELFAVELQEEKLRALSLMVWVIVALALAVAGILVGMAIVGVFLWEQAGYPGVIGLAVVTLGSSAILLWLVRRRILRGPGPFAGTISEMGKDLTCLHPQD